MSHAVALALIGTRAAGGPWLGKAAFLAVFALLLVWLLLLPSRLIGRDPKMRIPCWRSARFWAVVVTIAQIAAYAWWG
ncbi:MAG: hypothetical protein KJZ87_15960 [Thermoguttaceae bacterium]|nr:hypothetical protein [Thermoguttaceae bacterium]